MKSQNKSRRKISIFSEKRSGKGMWEINPDLQVQKSGVFVFVSVFLDTMSSSGNPLFIYVFIQIWSGVIVFVFSYGLWFIFRGICIYVSHIIWCTVHHHICRAQWAMGHKGIVLCADADDGSMPFLYCFLHSPYHIICSITMRNRCNLTKTQCNKWKFKGMNSTTGALLDMNVLNFIPI